MYCRHCGSLLSDGAKFCGNCGAPQPPLQTDYPDQTIRQVDAELQDVNRRLNQFSYQSPPAAPESYRPVDPRQYYGNQYGFTTPGSDASAAMRSGGARRCPRCGGIMNIQSVTEARKTGCGTVLLYVLLALTIFGLFIVIPLMLRRKTDTYTLAICQSCGYRQRM